MRTVQLSVNIGSSFEKSFFYRRGNNPVDLTGWAVVLRLRNGESVVVATMTSSPSMGIVLDPTQGAIYASLAAQYTATLVAGRGFFEVELTDPTGRVTRLLDGTVTYRGYGRSTVDDRYILVREDPQRVDIETAEIEELVRIDRGPPGPVGTTGSPGTQGAPGPAGAPGAGAELVTETATVLPSRTQFQAHWANYFDDGVRSNFEQHVRLARVNVTVVPTANLANLSAISASQNGITLAAGDTVLALNQTTVSERAFYRYASGVLTRITEFDDLVADGNGVYCRINKGTGGTYPATTLINIMGANCANITFMRRTRESFKRAHIEDYQLTTENTIAGSEDYSNAMRRGDEMLTSGRVEYTRREQYRVTNPPPWKRPVDMVGNSYKRGTGILFVNCGARKAFSPISTNTEAPDSLGPGNVVDLIWEYSGTFDSSTCHRHGANLLAGMGFAARIIGFPGHGIALYGDSVAVEPAWNSIASIGRFDGSIESCGLNGVLTQGADANNWKFTGSLFANNGLLLIHAQLLSGSAFDAADWTKGAGLTVTANVDGSADALTVAGGATSANTYITQNLTNAAANATENPPLTFSLKTRYVDVQWICVESNIGSATNRTWFDIQNGVVGTNGANHASAGGANRRPQPAPTISAIGATLANYRDLTWTMGASPTTTATFRIYLCNADNSLTPPAVGGIVRAVSAAVDQFDDWNVKFRDFLGSYLINCNFQASPGVLFAIGSSQKGGMLNIYSEASIGGGVDIGGANLPIGGRGMGTVRSANGYVAGTQVGVLEPGVYGLMLPSTSGQQGGTYTQDDVLRLIKSASYSSAFYGKYNGTGGNAGRETLGYTNANGAQNFMMATPNDASMGAGQMGFRYGIWLSPTHRQQAFTIAAMPTTGVLHALGSSAEGARYIGAINWTEGADIMKGELARQVISNTGAAAYTLGYGAIAHPSEREGTNLTGANQTISITGGSFRRMLAGVTAGIPTIIVDMTGTIPGHQITLSILAQADNVVIANGGGGGGTLDTVLANTQRAVTIQVNAAGTNWIWRH